MADWGVEPLLLRAILLTLQGANWQRSGGKGPKPKPVDLPGKTTEKPSTVTAAGDVVTRLRNLGMIPTSEAR